MAFEEDSREALQLNEKLRRAEYQSPEVTDLGNVEELTHGSREQTSDEPNSGYQGG